MTIQAGLCWTWSETKLLVFSCHNSFIGETDKDTTEVHDTLDSDKETDDVGHAGDADEVEGDDRMEVDENNNDMEDQQEGEAEHDNERYT